MDSALPLSRKSTTLYELGTPDKTIQDVLRHASLKTTLDVYVKARKEKSAATMVENLDAAVSEAESACAANVRGPKKAIPPLSNNLE